MINILIVLIRIRPRSGVVMQCQCRPASLPQLINNTKYGRMSLIFQVRGGHGEPGNKLELERERENNSAMFHDPSSGCNCGDEGSLGKKILVKRCDG